MKPKLPFVLWVSCHSACPGKSGPTDSGLPSMPGVQMLEFSGDMISLLFGVSQSGHLPNSLVLLRLLMLPRGSGCFLVWVFSFAIKLVPGMPVFPLKMSTVLRRVSYFYVLTLLFI